MTNDYPSIWNSWRHYILFINTSSQTTHQILWLFGASYRAQMGFIVRKAPWILQLWGKWLILSTMNQPMRSFVQSVDVRQAKNVPVVLSDGIFTLLLTQTSTLFNHRYCCRDHQVIDWNREHKSTCGNNEAGKVPLVINLY